jgi:DNA-directed RNA polymerase subunit beta
LTTNSRPTVSFAKLDRSMDMPHFLDVQREAFERLLQIERSEEDRRDLGLERVFNEIFPISDVNENFSLEFMSYALGEPKYSVEECIERDMTFAAPLKARPATSSRRKSTSATSRSSPNRARSS